MIKRKNITPARNTLRSGKLASTRPPTGAPIGIPNTSNKLENTGIKTATVGDEVYKPSPSVVKPSAPQMEYLPGPGDVKYPISGGNRGVTPLPGPGLIGIPEATPEAIAASKAEIMQKAAMNPPGSYTPPAGINMPGMRTPAPPLTPEQMMKKGGQVKAYASGGSVRGAGIAQRGVRKCKVY